MSFDGVFRPLSYDGLDSICSLAGVSLRTLDLRAVSRIKAALFPASKRCVEIAATLEHQVRVATDKMVRASRSDAYKAGVYGARIVAHIKLLSEGATFVNPLNVRRPFRRTRTRCCRHLLRGTR